MSSSNGCADADYEEISADMLPTPPSTHTSRSSSPTPVSPHLPDNAEPTTTAPSKKKKKKKAKKHGKPKEHLNASAHEEEKPAVLCISRNKHWRYISSYHGPWLQLPVELLESLLLLNLDPATLSAADAKLPPLPSPTHAHPPLSNSSQKQRDRGFSSLSDYSPPDSPRNTFTALPPPPPFPPPRPGKASPPPIDPGVFRSVTHIRRLIDEAAELSVRASSGMSAAALGSVRGGPGMGGNAWSTAQSLGLGSLEGGGRNVTMSAMRVHRLRALAVQKLASAYKTDEIASSVMVMQGGSVFDDIAERVLKYDPDDVDAQYVHFFHEKIPSRQLAESTSTQLLDQLIASHPTRLEYYRTRGIVHCFRDEYVLAVKDLTHAIKEARALRKARTAHMNNAGDKPRGKGSKKKKGKAGGSKTNGQAPPNGTSASAEGISIEGPDGEPILLHPSVLPDAPEPIEPQCIFLRAAAYLQHAVYLIEEAILNLEGIQKVSSFDGAEMRLCYIENGRYGGVEIGNPDGPLGRIDSEKLLAYRGALADAGLREQVTILVKKSMRDHRAFLAHFDTLEGSSSGDDGEVNIAARTEYAFLLSESLRPGSQSTPPTPSPDAVPAFTTYHPLLVESHFSVLLGHLLLGDFVGLLPAFARAAALIDGLEGYPIFLPPRSMAQAEFVEVLERLAGGWRTGTQPPAAASTLVVGGRKLLEAPLTALPPPSPRSLKAKEVVRIPTPPTPEVDDAPGPSRSSSSLAYTLGVNGSSSSSSSVAPRQSPTPSQSSSASMGGLSLNVNIGPQSPLSPSGSTSAGAAGAGLAETLDAARVLLAPVVRRQREKTDAAASDKGATGSGGGKGASKTRKPLNISIPLHGPRVEIVLAWMAAVFLCELEAVA